MSRGNLLLLGATLVLFVVAAVASGAIFHGDAFIVPDALGTVLAAFLTLAILSFLIRDNPLYKLAEHVFVGVAAGYTLVVAFWSTFVPNLWKPLAGLAKNLFAGAPAPEAGVTWTALLLVPALLGVLVFFRFFPKVAWLSRWSIAFLVGAYAGLACTARFQADLVMQASSTFEYQGRLDPSGGNEVTVFLYNLPILVGLLATLTYFFFSKPHRGIVGASARLGVFFLMAAFGASFGLTVMARISLFIGRVQFLLTDWLRLVT